MTAAASVSAVSASIMALIRAGTDRFIDISRYPKCLVLFRCQDCPLLDDIDEDITDEEMELLVNMDFDDFQNDANTLEG